MNKIVEIVVVASIVIGYSQTTGGSECDRAVFVCVSRDEILWRPLASMPFPRDRHSVAGPLNGFLYATGGRDTSGETVSTAFAYDIASDVWYEIAPMNTARSGHTSAVCQGKLYVFGGDSSMNTVEEYDPATGQWNYRAEMPVGLRFMTAETWRDSLVYILGGEQSQLLQNGVPYIYSPAEDSWASGTPMNTERCLHGSAIIGDTLVVWAGYKYIAIFPEDMEVGVIDPADPTSISWSVEDGIPAGGFSNTTGDEVAFQDTRMLVSSGGSFEDTRHFEGRTFMREIYGLMWIRPDDRPEPGCCADNGVGVGNVFYVPGGYNGEERTSRFFALELPEDTVYQHDVGVSFIDVPDVLPEDTCFCPQVIVKNYGASIEDFEVICEIERAGYSSSAAVQGLQPGEEFPVHFPDSAVLDSGAFWIMVHTELPEDEKPLNDALETRVEASVWYHNWLRRDDGDPVIVGAWLEAGNGWGTRFVTEFETCLDSLACFLDPDFALPADSTVEFRVYGADEGGRPDTADLRVDTVVTGIEFGWNKVELDTCLTKFESSEQFFVFYMQRAPYPEAPGMYCDILLEFPEEQWYYLDGEFGTPTNCPGDHMLRAHVVYVGGISEWLGASVDTPEVDISWTNDGKSIKFTVCIERGRSPLTAKVYDITGRCICVLADEIEPRKKVRLSWNLRDEAGREVHSGVYFLNVKTRSLSLTVKVLVCM